MTVAVAEDAADDVCRQTDAGCEDDGTGIELVFMHTKMRLMRAFLVSHTRDPKQQSLVHERQLDTFSSDPFVFFILRMASRRQSVT